ncbi:MAG TPA: electron transfer flavoprotein subunit alpha/FixB family protein [Candidatus Cloacimonetes bacterium]|nr:electron transfer flavoprotein subunit alpha/FixB family protein [Candidatus Cloacimonadota bacterium]
MSEIFVLIEHRQEEIRDISFELLACGRKLAEKNNSKLTAVVLGYNTKKIVEKIKEQAHRILIFDNEIFKKFNAETYQLVLSDLIQKENPFIFLIGHTAFGMDLCPALATQLKIPFTTDCLDIEIEGNNVKVIRQMFDGKLDAKVSLRENSSYILTVRSGSFPAKESNLEAEISNLDSPISKSPDYRKFIEYIEAVAGDVDITKSDVVIGIGRGIKEQDNLAMIEDFADSIGGVVACSRPIVDADWLPKDRQVGSSGKVIKPKLYIAIGISGAFQHVAGMKNAETIVAINKDANAPIFHEADYGIVDDLFKVIPVLKEKILEMK